MPPTALQEPPYSSAMHLSDDACYQAICARDARFDGRLFIGVMTTGIYCRPVCPSRIPKRSNVRFFATAAAAQEAGFRPCLRCRPETAPEIGVWRGSSNIVARALALIEMGALDDGGVEELSDKLGLGARHMSRLFARHVGASPIAVAQTRRVLLAKQLIHESSLPMWEVAMAAGFGSVRRFNETFQRLYQRPPSALRRAKAAEAISPGDEVPLLLRFKPPYEWSQMQSALSAAAIPGVEAIHDNGYARSFEIDGEVGSVRIQPTSINALLAQVRVSRLTLLPKVIARTRHLLDLGADPQAICQHLASDSMLASSVAARPGLRIVGSWEGFETAVRAALELLVDRLDGTYLLARMCAVHGAKDLAGIGEVPGLTCVFPTALTLAKVDLTELAAPPPVANAMRLIAETCRDQPDLFGPGQVPEELAGHLQRTLGLGSAASAYIADRVLRDSDAYLGAVEAGGQRPESGSELHRLDVHEHSERWRPWRAYARAHLSTGHLDAPT